MFNAMGGELPPLTALVTSVPPALLTILLIAFDVGLFVVMYRVAKLRGVGYLVVPPVVYILTTALLFYALYSPMFMIMRLVE